jgi:hypothetical protein
LKLSLQNLYHAEGGRARKEELRKFQLNQKQFWCRRSEVLGPEVAGEEVVEVEVIQRTIVPLQAPTRCNTCYKESSRLKRCTKCLKVTTCHIMFVLCRHRCILGAAHHIILTPANQLLVMGQI